MSRRILDKKSDDVTYLEFINEIDNKVATQWNSDSSNEGLFLDSKSEVLWSRENKNFFSESDFFHSFGDNSSGLTERTTSSCSWHNDDFDMNSSNKVKASLEGIEDALYEQKPSSLISESVFQECCDWAQRFPYFRLKGEQIVRPLDDSVVLYSSPQQNAVHGTENSPCSLQVEGKKMVIHVLERFFKKPANGNNVEDSNEAAACLEEILDVDGEYEECLVLDDGEAHDKGSKDLDEEFANAESLKHIEEKVVEKIALELWPMVLAVLQNIQEPNVYIPDKVESTFQLPPIVSVSDPRTQRPRTEGTDLLAIDFPSLSSILTISPKVLQSKDETGHWKPDIRSSRPSSEIHFSRRNHTIPGLRKKHEALKVSPCLTQLNSFIQVQSLSRKTANAQREDKAQENVSQLLPALEEDIPECGDGFIEFRPSIRTKEASSKGDPTLLSKRNEGFLPPIERRTPISANVKLTRNLFTFFGSDLKCDKLKESSSIHRISRPNTSVSRKVFKYSGNMSQKHPGRPSTNNTNTTDTKKLNEVNIDKQVTLFPIVTPLAANKEGHSARRGLMTSFSNKRKR